MTTIYLGLGSNLGNREENLRHAIAMLTPEIVVTKKSPVFETPAMVVVKQPKFLNAVVEATTDLSAPDVLKKIKSIEREQGEHAHNQPRTIDIDLLFYGNVILETPDLIIPHPGIAERAFVLVPMVAIAPDFLHPLSGATMTKLLQGIPGFTAYIKKTEIEL